MRKFNIKVNGKSYEVEVEEAQNGVPAAPEASAPHPAPAANKPAPAPEKPAAASPSIGAEGSVKMKAPMPGNIVDVKVKPGDAVRKSQVVLILEAMKMENEIMAPQDGKVASVHVTKGATVNSGDLLITLD
ncbi:biotin/lipoyl-binding protein [Eubacteriales bacterium mix99]|jgi:biotin carboxyl carrier protein